MGGLLVRSYNPWKIVLTNVLVSWWVIEDPLGALAEVLLGHMASFGNVLQFLPTSELRQCDVARE